MIARITDMHDKEVINICDGRRLGRPIDLVLNENACAEALVVPGQYSLKWLLLLLLVLLLLMEKAVKLKIILNH